MENFYQMNERFINISFKYDSLMEQFESLMDETGGEVTEESEQMVALLAEVDALKAETAKDIIEHADDYAAIYKNKEAQKKVIEAELKAIKDEQKKVVDKYNAKIARLERSMDFWKQNFVDAMNFADCKKIGGAKTNNRFSIYFSTSNSLAVDDATVLEPFKEMIAKLEHGLPEYMHVKVDINKTELKRETKLPNGAVLVESKSLQIR